MSKNVFANGREVSAKADDNKSICMMPDVCLTPPSPPAGPIPIPYPNTAKAADTSDGSKTVCIDGKEVGLKDKSNYKTSTGDEAATKSQGMGVVTATIQGKLYFAAWSFDVLFEGENAIRHMDLTTGNHASSTMNSGDTGVSQAAQAQSTDPECKKLNDANNETRSGLASNSSDKTIVGPDKDGSGTTVASSRFKPAKGPAIVQSSHNNKKANNFAPNDLAEGSGGQSHVNCPGVRHSHAHPRAQKAGHAEARMVDDLFEGGAPGAGKMTINIDWIPKNGSPSKMPCEDCHKMLCAAKKCGVQVSLCDSKGKKQELKEDEHCPKKGSPTKAHYQNLRATMGET